MPELRGTVFVLEAGAELVSTYFSFERDRLLRSDGQRLARRGLRTAADRNRWHSVVRQLRRLVMLDASRAADVTRERTTMITKLDFVAIPSQDSERSRQFYGEILGLRSDRHGQFEFWAGDTCLGIWEPTRFGMEFVPQKNGHLALHVEDVGVARAELEGKGVTFLGETLDTGVCHMAFFTDPDGNDLLLHHRYAPLE
jgi:catechol 2,3-dioxygenase-like lactoylglutathione lyase family enzyme